MKVEILSLGPSAEGWFARFSSDGKVSHEPLMCWALARVSHVEAPESDSEPHVVVVGVISGPPESLYAVTAIEDCSFEGYDHG